MRKILLITCAIITASSLCRKASPSGQNPIKRWGYVAHYASLSQEYIQKTVPKYDIIAITGFRLRKNGALLHHEGKTHRAIYQEARKHKKTIYPLITFASVSQGKALLSGEKNVKRGIAEIVKLLSKYDGIHLDFEYLPPSFNKKLALFLKKLRGRTPDGHISMAVFPKIGFPEKYSGLHDMRTPSKYLDEIVVMCYDYHRKGTPPGPVTDLRWAEKNIEHYLTFFPGDKIWLGVPAYGYLWKGRKVRAVSARYGVKLMKRNSWKRTEGGSVVIHFPGRDKPHVLYLSDSIQRKGLTRLAERHNLAGTALWRLGFEE